MASRARDRLLLSTIDLVRRNGVAGTGITELVAHSGVARRSIYNNFPGGKDELVAAAVAWAQEFIASGITADASPAAIIDSVVEMWATVLKDSDFDAGCPVVAGALAGTESPAARAAAADAFEEWVRLIADRLAAPGTDPEVARHFAVMAVCAIEGAVVLAVAQRSLEPLTVIRDQLKNLLVAVNGVPR